MSSSYSGMWIILTKMRQKEAQVWVILILISPGPASWLNPSGSCIQSDRPDTTVHVYGSWFSPWFPSMDRRYTSQSKGKLTYQWTMVTTVKDVRSTPPDDTGGTSMMMVMWLIKALYGSEKWSCSGLDLGEIFSTCIWRQKSHHF